MISLKGESSGGAGICVKAAFLPKGRLKLPGESVLPVFFSDVFRVHVSLPVAKANGGGFHPGSCRLWLNRVHPDMHRAAGISRIH
jgi:hypothetical protein